MSRKMKRKILVVLLSMMGGAAFAQTTTPVPTEPEPVVISSQDLRYAQRIQGRFGTLAGSPENLQSIVTGLRHGTEIKLTNPTTTTTPPAGGTGGTGTTTTTSSGSTFTAPTKPMGYGNITRALDLAQRELAA